MRFGLNLYICPIMKIIYLYVVLLLGFFHSTNAFASEVKVHSAIENAQCSVLLHQDGWQLNEKRYLHLDLFELWEEDTDDSQDEKCSSLPYTSKNYPILHGFDNRLCKKCLFNPQVLSNRLPIYILIRVLRL